MGSLTENDQKIIVNLALKLVAENNGRPVPLAYLIKKVNELPVDGKDNSLYILKRNPHTSHIFK